MTVNFGAGKAEMTATDLPVVDYFTIPNALFHFATPVAATCSFDISWNVPVTDRSPVNAPSGSSGELVMCHATIPTAAALTTCRIAASKVTFAYVAAFDPAGVQRDAMTVIDCDSNSASFGKVLGWTDPSAGNEFHYFGWNACSSANAY